MTNFQLKESAVADFQLALQRAGMQRSSGTDPTKPKYYRGTVTDTSSNIFLNFQVTDNLEEQAADNSSWIRTVYINGSYSCRNGFGDPEFQELANNIEIECNSVGIDIVFTTDQSITPVDTESPIISCDFEATKTILKGDIQ